MEYILNNIIVRIVAGIFIGLPLTAIALIGGAHGLILGYAGIINAEFGLLLLGILTITGFIGIFGAWRRLFDRSDLMTNEYNKKTRFMLIFGLVTSFLLTVWAVKSEGLTAISIPFIILTAGSILFVAATPKFSNNAFKRGAEKASRPLN